VRKDKKMVGWGHVTPCAGRCAGPRQPEHARRPLFVRSRRHAHVHPRRAIRLSAGALCHAHQNSHICLWLRTTSAEWRSEGKSWTRPTSTEHPPCNVRCVSTSHITAIAAVGSHAAGLAASCFASIAPSMLPLPCFARHAAPRLAAPGCAGAALILIH
jgi:hypothetical protein